MPSIPKYNVYIIVNAMKIISKLLFICFISYSINLKFTYTNNKKYLLLLEDNDPSFLTHSDRESDL